MEIGVWRRRAVAACLYNAEAVGTGFVPVCPNSSTLLDMTSLPRMISVLQAFPETPPVDVPTVLRGELHVLGNRVRPGDSIAIGVGSRGIAGLHDVLIALIAELKKLGTNPFLIPAMGSHGGATADGQREVLASYGITEESMSVPIRDSMDVEKIGETPSGVPVYCSREALNASGILLVNRIKPHTDFFGNIGSGLLKMSVIGLGKRMGATAMHLAATQLGYENVLRAMSRVVLDNCRLLGGIALLENQRHQLAELKFLPHEMMATAEDALLVRARAWMPMLPFRDIDLLIVDRIGKDISGAGMDPNVIHRSVHGYSSLYEPTKGGKDSVDQTHIRRIFVRGLTTETHGNAIGIGMADVTTHRLVQEMDMHKTSINALTALTPQSAKIPIAFGNDQDAIESMLRSLPISDWSHANVVRVRDTLSVANMSISESLWNQYRDRGDLLPQSELSAPHFDEYGNLD